MLGSSLGSEVKWPPSSAFSAMRGEGQAPGEIWGRSNAQGEAFSSLTSECWHRLHGCWHGTLAWWAKLSSHPVQDLRQVCRAIYSPTQVSEVHLETSVFLYSSKTKKGEFNFQGFCTKGHRTEALKVTFRKNAKQACNPKSCFSPSLIGC